MKIYDKSSAEALWEIVKPLLDYGKSYPYSYSYSTERELPIYKEVMDEDENDVPDSYLLIRRDVADRGRIFGDGKTQYRQSSCDLILVSKSKGQNSSDLHVKNIDRVKAALTAAGVRFEGYNLGYNETQKTSEYTWTVDLLYG